MLKDPLITPSVNAPPVSLDQAANDQLFANLIISLSLILLIYSPIFAFFNAPHESAILLFGTVFLCPLIYFMSRYGFPETSGRHRSRRFY